MNEPIVPPECFRDPDRSMKITDSLCESFVASGSRFAPDEFTLLLRSAIVGSPDPDMMLTNVSRYLGAVANSASLFSDLLQYPLWADVLFRLCGTSQYFADVLVREPGLFRRITGTDVLTSSLKESFLKEEVERIASTFQKPESQLNALKRLHRRELLRIGAQDILGHADVAAATFQLSLLADAVIDAALQIATRQMNEKFGWSAQIPFCVVGLGKLGGSELNYSSDIDVIFVYAEERDADDRGNPGAHEYFTRLAERLIRHLTQLTDEGYLYRVDVRLRPEAGAGPLVRSMESYTAYYESRGEMWERQMLIKARPVAGDKALGREFLKNLEPFVYPRSFMTSPAASVARIKARIEATVGDEANVKLMPGGIRDIEFIVQTLQLLNGGRNPAVRERNTIKAINALGDAGHLTTGERRDLESAYAFFRMVEHRLQTMLNTQTHTLPSDDQALGVLGRRCGIASVGEMRGTLVRHLTSVRRIFNRVLGDGSGGDISALVEEGVDETSLIRILGACGFHDPRQAMRHLKVLTTGNAITGATDIDTRTREAFRSVAAVLFADITRTPSPDITLASLSALAASQKALQTFYAHMDDQRFRRFVVDICAVSPRFARGLARNPLLMESLVSDPEALGEARAFPDATDLVEFKEEQELRAGVRHILGFTGFDELTGELTRIASFVVASLLARDSKGEKGPRLAVFALGKFGTAELGLDADLDLLFVSGEDEGSEDAKAEKRAATLVAQLSATTARGRLYTVDARLRPEGKSAPLVVAANAYAKYLESRASLWERQSLTRLRFVAGDKIIGSFVESLAASKVYDAPLPQGWSREIAAMRRKMEPTVRGRGRMMTDIKTGAGGMVDVEFIVQMIQMKIGASRPSVRGLKILPMLRSPDASPLRGDEGGMLAAAYTMYRRIEFLMRVTLEERGYALPEGEKLDSLARLYDGSSGGALSARVATAMKYVRTVFLDVVTRVA